MQLKKLLQPWVNIAADINVLGITVDSRQIKAGDLFVALNRGVEFIPAAIAQGATAIVVNSEHASDLTAAVPIIAIDELQTQYGLIASRFYEEPSKELTIIGITGTNGKTSISHYIAQLLMHNGERCGIIGTLGVGELKNLSSTGLTTPDAVTVHQTLKKFVDAGIKYVAMEVSSHALVQHRVGGVKFDVAVFTNLTHDHLDFHGSMQAYGNAKKTLFTDYGIKHSIINIDDAFGRELIHDLKNSVSYGIHHAADVTASDIHYSAAGIQTILHTSWGEGKLSLSLLGEFNLTNVLASIAAVASCSNLNFKSLLAAAKDLQAVNGRMQCFRHADKPLVVVDYAHTPDALAKALTALQKHCDGELWCVFGCGGDRDASKRPIMAHTAETYAQHVIVTSDNPRHEKPLKIIDDIKAGFEKTMPHIEADRAQAIAFAIDAAKPADTILIAGKGHENYQQIGDEKLPFSDSEQVHNNFY